MKSAEEFLVNFRDQPTSERPNAAASASESVQDKLDSTLAAALKRRWYIAPVLARSKYFSKQAIAGTPTLDPIQIRQWADAYRNSECNWIVETGERSSLVILEFDYELGSRSLEYLCQGDRSWQRTLQFTDSKARFVCFHYSGERIRGLGKRLPGIRLYFSACLLIPPSIYVNGSEVSYLNPGATVSAMPDWMLESANEQEQLANLQNKTGDNTAA